MVDLPGYRLTAQLSQSSRSAVYRGLRLTDDLPVIVKTMIAEHPSAETRHRYRREFEITSGFDFEGVPVPVALEKAGHGLAIITADMAGENLKKACARQTFTLAQLLRFAIEIVKIVGRIHGAGFVHRDLKPGNIIANPQTGQTAIIDFGSAIELAAQGDGAHEVGLISGTLPYIAPEQTGRMHRSVDWRADFYAFGATLYEIFCGRLPFQTEDTLELIHAHIARRPAAPFKVNPEIPPGLSDLILKLMAKDPEERYQSAAGIQADLEFCLTTLSKNGTIAAFPLGRHDVSDRLQVPAKLYGRDESLSQLENVFSRVCDGQKAVAIVYGQPGTGKTALVKALGKPVTLARGHFICGRYDHFERDVPYSAIVSAFTDLVRQLLTRGESELARWRERLAPALGSTGCVIVDLIPELELIIGPQPDAPELEPIAAQNRLNLTFSKFIRVFCRPESPLALCLDQLHAADAATFRLLGSIMADPDIQFLFVLGTCVPENVNADHPLLKTMEKMKAIENAPSNGIQILSIHIEPLSPQDVRQLVAETLRCESEYSRTLAETVLTKTGGNPFFIKEFLRRIHKQGLLVFDAQTATWCWDPKQLRGLGVMEKVAAVMAERINNLEIQSREVLTMAAAVGSRFRPKVVADLMDQPAARIATRLQPAVSNGLVAIEKEGTFRFSHERIRRAVYSLVPAAQRAAIHLRLGRQLLAATPAENLQETIFDVIGHLNIGAHQIENEAEICNLAELNVLAGKRARGSAAWQTALAYFSTGIDLLGDDGWQNRYKLTLKLHNEAAEAAFLSTRFDRMKQLIETVLGRAGSLGDKARVLSIRIQYLAAHGRHTEAARLARTSAAKLGIKYPAEPSRARLMWGIIYSRLTVADKRIEELSNLPDMDAARAPNLIQAWQMLSKAAVSTFFTSPGQAAFMSITAPVHIAKFGAMDTGALGLLSHGIVVSSITGGIDRGYRFGLAGLKMAERFPRNRPRAVFIFNAHIRWWQNHLRESARPLAESFQGCLDNGDLETAALCAHIRCTFGLLTAKNPAKLLPKIESRLDAVRAMDQESMFTPLGLLGQICENLLTSTDEPWQFQGRFLDEKTAFPKTGDADAKTALFAWHTYKTFLSYLFGRIDLALDHGSRAQRLITFQFGIPLIHLCLFYHSLALIAAYGQAPPPIRKRYRRQVAKNQKILKKWAGHAPMNFMHKYRLVEAERARISAKIELAMDHYDEAIAGAQANEYVHEAALANELAARFYQSRNKPGIAAVYLREAHYGYRQWGAATKVSQLEALHPDLLARIPENDAIQTSTLTTTPSNGTATSDSNQALDMASAIKATRAMSGEIVFKKFLARFMEIVMESAGARKGFLIVAGDQRLLIQAESDLAQGLISVRQALPLDECPRVCHGIVNYAARTREVVMLDDATRPGKFTGEPYIVEHQPKSILCTPLIHRDKLAALLYLENDLVAGAFTTERLGVLNLICSQGAVSLENARLYEQLADHAHHLEEIIAALNVAQEVQQSLLPQRPPQIEGLDLAGRSQYCDETGGDYYDFIRFQRGADEGIGIAVGDVSGHGISSALLMSSVRVYLRAKAEDQPSAAGIIGNVNRLVSADTMETGQFMTLFYLELMPRSRLLTWVRAGHDPAVLYTPETEQFEELGGGGIALGVDEEWRFQEYSRQAMTGQILMLTTDGIFEAHNSREEMFGKQRFFEVVRHNHRLEAEGIRKTIIEAVAAFRGASVQEDDITLVVIKFL